MERKRKVLIIKTGYSEILDKESNSRKVSLGDVLRTTVLLNLFKNDSVTWITDPAAMPLLENNPYTERVLPYDFTTVLQIEAEEFDVVINLEKIPGICAWADKIKAWKKYGFRFDSKTGNAEAYDQAYDVLTVSSDSRLKKENTKTAQELLYGMVGAKWNGETYILQPNSKTQEAFDVGLNTLVGQKWPTKEWSMDNWDALEIMLKNAGFKVSRQDKQGKEILENLESYIEWINSSKLIISNDSLGMHLGIALHKKVLGLFGPTPHQEVYFYGKGKAILPEPIIDCIPCFKGKCENGKKCIETITPERVFEEAKSLLSSM